MKSKSVCEAAGKPTLDFLEPNRHELVEHARACAPESIGSMSAWLPSRRSTLHHAGGAVSVRFGQVRSGRLMGANGRYFA